MLQTQTPSPSASRRAASTLRPEDRNVAPRVTLGRVQKIVIRKAGSHDRLELVDAEPLVAGPGEVLIDVRAIGVNYADCMVRMGLYSSAKELVGWPITPGFEVSGVVVAVGEGVDDVELGSRVFAVTLFNGYASQVAAPRRYVFPIPEAISFEQAASFPSVFLTAWFALHELAHPRRGNHVLVHSAAGGVGGALVQLAKRAGCVVTGVVGSTHKIKLVRELGADHVIDKSSEDLWARAEALAPQGFDVVCDANGVATLGQSYAHLRPAGKLVVYGFHTMMPRKSGRPNWLKLAVDYVRTPRFNPLELTESSKSVLAFNLSYLYDRTDLLEAAMTDLSAWLADGSARPLPVTTYPLADAARAHQAIESGQTVGKLVLVPPAVS